MITSDTAQAILGEMASGKDPAYLQKLIASFVQKEPHLFAFISIALGNMATFSNPVSAALIALSLYEKMRLSQECSDDLSKKIGGQIHKKGEGPS